MGFFYFYSTTLISTVKNGSTEFQRDRKRVQDLCEETSEKYNQPAIIEKVHVMILENRRTKVRDIGNSAGKSKECIGYIFLKESHK